jgi:F420 biosynthesis protein FbiB-like protein
VNNIELHAWLRSRRSVRRFLPQPVAAETLARILETATWAPNAHNRQPWRFVILESAESRAQLAGAMGAEFERVLRAEALSEAEVLAQSQRSRARLLEAPAAVLLCLDTTVLDEYEDAGRTQGEALMGAQSVALAGGQLLLAAHAEGLGGVWICAPLFVPAEVSRALDLPAGWQAQGVVLLGYAAKPAPPRPRQDLHDVVRKI